MGARGAPAGAGGAPTGARWARTGARWARTGGSEGRDGVVPPALPEAVRLGLVAPAPPVSRSRGLRTTRGGRHDEL